MSNLISILIVILGCFVISFVVFGGAQMFIPYFKILLVNILKVDPQDWESVLSIANATPGVFGLKLAISSGYLAANGQWWGWLLMILTYLVFILVPVIVMMFAMKQYHKIENNNFMKSFLKIMRPIIAGILISIAFNLALSLILPFVGFNDLGTNFGDLDQYLYWKDDFFFQKWRYWVLLGWSLVAIPVDLYLIRKYKINIAYIIVVQIVICMILFQPWLL